MAHMMIVQPLTGASLQSLFGTHPSTEERIARLRDFGRQSLGYQTLPRMM
jgi:heat shock protein HtpX